MMIKKMLTVARTILLILLYYGSECYGNDWALEIPGGSDKAEIVAKENGLINLGRVFPDADIYHFRGSPRIKRSSNGIQEEPFFGDSVTWVEKQVELVRVKRDNTERLDENRRTICFISTFPEGNKPGRDCVFPFTYKGATYSRCTKDFSANGKEWCATAVTPEGNAVKNHWADCNPASLRCQTTKDGAIRTTPAPFILQPPVHPLYPVNSRVYPALSDLFKFFSANRAAGLVEEEVKTPKTPRNLSGFLTKWNDPLWPDTWYLNRGRNLDMKVEGAWEKGYSGKGVVVTILDDGVEWDHPDLEGNYDPEASIDLNGNDPDPYPRYDDFNSNKHGTRCAGQVAAIANNSFCSVGIAYGAKVGGIRILDGRIFDLLEAHSLSHNRDYIDVYSASWGPDDNGKTVDGPGPLARKALKDGVVHGRGGKGSIFVWASGNGGKRSDDCNCDGYTTSIYTLSVSSTSENGVIPWYSEACASSLATTYSSGSSNRKSRERKISTTDLHGKCTSSHTGTSASSPMAAGMIALALEANGALTWRDMQHIVVESARGSAGGYLKADDWATNGVGRRYSHSYGFGLMDAEKMVNLARNWTLVKEQVVCETPDVNADIDGEGSEIISYLDASECSSFIDRLEHVHLRVDLDGTSRRGDLSVVLMSPLGTVSTLLAKRPFDDARTGLDSFAAWPMMSVHFWDEPLTKDGKERWKLTVRKDGTGSVSFRKWKLIFYGTKSS